MTISDLILDSQQLTLPVPDQKIDLVEGFAQRRVLSRLRHQSTQIKGRVKHPDQSSSP